MSNQIKQANLEAALLLAVASLKKTESATVGATFCSCLRAGLQANLQWLEANPGKTLEITQ